MKIKKVPCEMFTRVVGYYRPVAQFNKGKQEEFKDRVTIKLEGLEQKLADREMKK